MECLIQGCKNKVQGIVWNTRQDNQIIKFHPTKPQSLVVTIPGLGPHPVCRNHMELVQDPETTSVYGLPN